MYVTHGLGKGILFMMAGSIILQTGTRSMSREETGWKDALYCGNSDNWWIKSLAFRRRVVGSCQNRFYLMAFSKQACMT